MHDILDAMEKRGEKPGNHQELLLAQEIREKLEQGRVAYPVFKGNPVDTYQKGDNNKMEWTGDSTANGYDHQIFDLSEKEK